MELNSYKGSEENGRSMRFYAFVMFLIERNTNASQRIYCGRKKILRRKRADYKSSNSQLYSIFYQFTPYYKLLAPFHQRHILIFFSRGFSLYLRYSHVFLFIYHFPDLPQIDKIIFYFNNYAFDILKLFSFKLLTFCE